MTADLPERIEIEILADGLPLPRSLADLSLSMLSKNPHTMVLGPADASGHISASKADLLAQAHRNCSNFVMDYSDLTTHFGGSVEVKPVTPRRVVELQKAYERFAPAFVYPPHWRMVLESLKQWFSEHKVKSLEARVRVVPFEIRISARTVLL